ncbi:FtsX-like permease family protein [Streptomyces sp. NPDC090108]|uniref:FtsX-like permease family protein n=1 Tax=Streptomyces sp. NPDC090108 TaxID=3365947 RepID=UPI0038128314
MGQAPRAVAPWVRTRLRTAPGAAPALALLVALTAALAAALPLAVDRYEDAGLVHAVRAARPDRTTVRVTAPLVGPDAESTDPDKPVDTARLRQQYGKVLGVAGGLLPVDRDQSSYGVMTDVDLPVPDAWLPAPSGAPAHVSLMAPDGLGAHARVRSGRLPRTTAPVDPESPRIEAAVTAETAKRMHIEVGSVVHLPAVGRPPVAAEVTGILTPRDPDGAYWSTVPLMQTPSLVPIPDSVPVAKYWLGTLLIPQKATPALLSTRFHPSRYWFVAPRLTGLRARGLDGLRHGVASLENGPGLSRTRAATGSEADVDSDLDNFLNSFAGLRSTVSPLVSVAAAGAATVAAVVLCMAGGLAADRRRAELALLRARGASLPGLAGRLLAETAVAAVPAGALGLAAALLLLPAHHTLYAFAAAAAVTLTACAALPLAAVLAHRRVRATVPRADAASVRPSRRRLVLELTLLVPAAGAVEALRRRGTTGDQLISLAPVLIAVIATLLLLRLQPPLLRLAGRPAGRLRGAVALLSLARAGRTSGSGALPLLALLTALTTAAFGGSVLSGVAAARDRAALLTVGADARVEYGSPLPSGLAARVRSLPGVHEVAAASITYEATLGTTAYKVPVAGVDPGTYSALAARTGLGAFPERVLNGKGPHAGSGTAPLPALASPGVARDYGTDPLKLWLPDGSTVTVRITTVRDRTPAVPGSEFLVVDRAGLPGNAARPTSLLLTGTPRDAGALRRTAGSSAGVHTLTEERARYADSPLQTGAVHVYTAAVAAGAGLAVLALLLALLRAAPERAALLARLRTMGLTRAQGRRLLILESLPQALLAAAGGALTGWTAVQVLSPGVDLLVLAMPSAGAATDRAVLVPDLWSLAVPTLTVVVVAVGVAALQAWWTGRRGSVTELRAGDAR